MFKILWPELSLCPPDLAAANHCWTGFIATDCIDFKIATLSYKAVHLKQMPSVAQHLKLKSIDVNTRHNNQLLLQHLSVNTNSYGRPAFRYISPRVGE